MDQLTKDLEEALIGRLGAWQEALSEEPRRTDDVSLFCLYPKLLSYMAWTCGTMSEADKISAALLHREKKLSDGGALISGCSTGGHFAAAAYGAGCCPCCGGSHDSPVECCSPTDDADNEDDVRPSRRSDPGERSGSSGQSRSAGRSETPPPDRTAEAEQCHQHEVIHRETRIVEETVIEEMENDERDTCRGDEGRGRGRGGGRC